MRLPLIFILGLFWGCSIPETVRGPASSTTGEVDFQKSILEFMPGPSAVVFEGDSFYVVLKDSKNRYLDLPDPDFSLRTTTKKALKINVKRVLAGRFYVNLEEKSLVRKEKFNFYVQGKPLKENFKLYFHLPDENHSKISVTKLKSGGMLMKLTLRDHQNRPLDTQEIPEVVIDGIGETDSPVKIGAGIWEFSVTYPEQNQIMYFSVRSLGIYMPKLFRYQHVEK